MEPRAYYLTLDYKRDPVVIFVSQGLSRDQWGTFYRKPNGSLKRLQRSCLNMVDSFDQAQAMLDQFALQKELRAAELPDGIHGHEDPTALEADPSSEIVVHDGDIDLLPGDLLELERLNRRLESANRDWIKKKNEKASAVAAFNGELKEIEEEIEQVLSDMDGIRNKANRPQGTLPFEGDSRHEPEHPEDGACNSCGHDQAAHYDDDHAPRPCSVAGCGCMAAETEAAMQAEASA